MKVLLLYKRNTPADRDIQYLQKRLDEIRIQMELIDADTREGAAITELYGLLGRPAVAVVTGDGQVVQVWQGALPTVTDVQNAYGPAL